jgi:hypothetical protein
VLLWYLEAGQDVGGGGREESLVVLVLRMGMGIGLNSDIVGPGLGLRPLECHMHAISSYEMIVS